MHRWGSMPWVRRCLDSNPRSFRFFSLSHLKTKEYGEPRKDKREEKGLGPKKRVEIVEEYESIPYGVLDLKLFQYSSRVRDSLESLLACWCYKHGQQNDLQKLQINGHLLHVLTTFYDFPRDSYLAGDLLNWTQPFSVVLGRIIKGFHASNTNLFDLLETIGEEKESAENFLKGSKKPIFRTSAKPVKGQDYNHYQRMSDVELRELAKARNIRETNRMSIIQRLVKRDITFAAAVLNRASKDLKHFGDLIANGTQISAALEKYMKESFSEWLELNDPKLRKPVMAQFLDNMLSDWFVHLKEVEEKIKPPHSEMILAVLRKQNLSLQQSLAYEIQDYGILFKERILSVDIGSCGLPTWFSFSLLNVFWQCPMQFYFKYIMELPPDYKKPDTTRKKAEGKALHKVAEKIVEIQNQKGLSQEVQEKETQEKEIQEKEIQEVFHTEMEKNGFVSTPAEKTISNKVVSEYTRRKIIEEPKVKEIKPEKLEKEIEKDSIISELELQFSMNGFKFRGTIDQVIKSKEGIIIKELKRNLYGRKAQDNLQLGIYGLGYFLSTQVMPTRLELECITTGDISSHTVTSNYLGEIHNLVLDTIHKIERGKFEANPTKHSCQGCDWKHVCPASVVMGPSENIYASKFRWKNDIIWTKPQSLTPIKGEFM